MPSTSQQVETHSQSSASPLNKLVQKLDALRARQGVLAIGDQAIISGTNFLTTIAIGRWCGPEGLGIFGLGLTLIYLLVATQESLITTAYTVFIARADEEEKPSYRASTFLSYVLLAALSATLFSAAAAITSLADVSSQYTYALYSLALVGPCWLLREFARRSAYAEFKIAISVAINLIVMVIQVSGLFVLASLDNLTPTTGFLVVATANLLAGATWFIISKNTMKFGQGILVPTLKKHWGLGKVMFLSQLVHALSSQALPWLIAFCLGTSATGIFIACEQIIRLSNPLLVGFTNILTPRTAHAYADNGSSGLHQVVKRAMAVFSAIMLLFCVVIALLGSPIMGKLFGDEYVAYTTVLVILVISKAIESISIGPGRGLLVLEKVSECLKADVVKFVLTFIATIILMWQLEILGAAYAMLIGTAVYSAVMTRLYWKALNAANQPATETATTSA